MNESSVAHDVATKPAGSDKIKVTFNFAPDTYNALVGIAKTWRTTQGEALRRAVALLTLYQTVQANGDDLMVRKHKSKELELIKLL